MTRPVALLFGVPIADVSMSEALDRIGAMIDAGRRTGATHQIATVNVDFLVNALDSPALGAILRSSDLCLADGTPIVWATAALGMPIAERVAGSDLVPLLFERSRATGWRIHVFGSSADVADRARTLVERAYPGAAVTFEPGPIFADVGDVPDDVLASIAAVDADIVCVALGNPKQERFIHTHRHVIGAPVFIGIGGSIDMLVGERTRAPVWMQRIGMEWIARAVQEPRRLGRRYAHDIRVAVPRFVTDWRAARQRRTGSGMTIEVADDEVRVRLFGRELPGAVEWSDACFALTRGDGPRVGLVIDPDTACVASNASVARLVSLVQLARSHDRTVAWSASPAALRPCLDSMAVTPEMVGSDSEWSVHHSG